MFGFPVNLQDSNVQTFSNYADSGFPKIQQREIFYSVRTGNWTDPTTWQTASGRVGILPTSSDDVYIRHNVSLNFPSNLTFSCNNIFCPKEGTLTLSGQGGTIGLNIFGDFRCFGTLQQTVQGINLNLYGANNYVDRNTNLSNVGISYLRNGYQEIMDLQYSNLTIGGAGYKTTNSNVNVSNSFFIFTTLSNVDLSFDLRWYDLFCGGLCRPQYPLIKRYPGNIVVVGLFDIRTKLIFNNVNVELRGGISTIIADPSEVTGTWTFTTNNQNITISNTNPIWYCDFVIGSGLTITLTNTINTFNLSGTINGASSTSKFVNQGNLGFVSAASVASMTTGIVDFTTSANTVSYSGNYTATIPSYFPTFHNVTITGTGIKTLGANTTLNGNLVLNTGNASSGLECSTFNLSVTGTTSASTGFGLLKKSGSGNVLFVGSVQLYNGSTSYIDFSGGNPNVELRGGMSVFNASTLFKSGTGTWTFTTNNQSVTRTGGTGGNVTFDGNILISGAITLTWSIVEVFIINGTINGDNASSKLLLGTSTPTINYQSATQPMATGILDTSTNLNTWIYGNANQDIKGGPTTLAKQVYRNLTLNGGGTKTLQGYVSVLNTYTLTSPATLNNNGFTLTNP